MDIAGVLMGVLACLLGVSLATSAIGVAVVDRDADAMDTGVNVLAGVMALAGGVLLLVASS
jgi:hypothetical protein